MIQRIPAFRLASLAGALALGCAGPAVSQTTYEPAVQKHLDAATVNAAGDQDLINYIRKNSCFEVEDLNWRTWARAQDEQKVPLTQLFDNLWVVGTKYTAMYFLKTADNGLLLIDTLNNTADANNVIIPALQELKLPIRGIYITHGHGDHDGGVARLREVYGNDFPVYIGSGDAASKTYKPTPIDSANENVQTITVGGTSIQVQAAPGHTPGNQTSLIPVSYKGETRLLVMNWRSAVPSAANTSKQYVTGIERVFKMAQDYGAVGYIHTHAVSDATLPTIEKVMTTKSRDSIPLFFGADRTARAAVVARECSAARAQQIDATAVFPVWRYSTLEFNEKPSFSKASAVLKNGWGPIANQQVKFTIAGANMSCVAQTNSQGVASCDLPTGAPGSAKITATFSGTQTKDFVDTPTSVQSELPEASGGCSMVNGRFDPMLAGLALLAGVGMVRRRKISKR